MLISLFTKNDVHYKPRIKHLKVLNIKYYHVFILRDRAILNMTCA